MTQRIISISKAAAAVVFAALITLTSGLLAADQPVAIDVGGQQLDGAWLITLAADSPGAAPPQKTSGILSRDGTVYIHNTVPDTAAPPGMPPTKTIHGVGEWVRVGNREFALTWTYIIINANDGTYFGMFQDRATLRYNADLTELSGDFTFEVTLADGMKVFSGKGRMTATRIRIVPL